MSDDPADITEAWQIEAQLPALRADEHHDLAAALAERLLELREAALGPAHPDTLQVVDALAEDCFQSGRYDRAAALLERLIAAREAADPADPVALGAVLAQLAKVRRRAGDLDAAYALYQRAMDVYGGATRSGLALPGVATTCHGFASLLLDRGELPEAEKVCRAALDLREKMYPPDAPQIAETVNLLAVILRHAGDLDGAEALYLRALAVREQKQGKDHPEHAITLINLGRLYTQNGKHDKAAPILARAAALIESRDGAPDELAAGLLDAQSHHWKATGEGARALDAARRVLALREQLLGPTHPDVAAAQNHLAALLADDRATRPEAEALLRRALAALAETSSATLVPTLLNLGHLRLWAGDTAEAEVLAQRAHDVARARSGAQHEDVATALHLLSMIAEERDDHDRALELMLGTLQIHNKKPTVDQAVEDFTRIGELFLAADMPDQAAKFLKDALGIAARARGQEHPTVGHLIYLAAKVATAQEQPKLALHCLDTALPILEKAKGRTHPGLLPVLDLLADANAALSKYGAAEKAIARIAEIYAATHPPESEHQALAPIMLGDVAMKRKDPALALAHYERALSIVEPVFGAESLRLQVILDKAGEAALAAGALPRAEELSRRLLTMYEAVVDPDDTSLLPPVRRVADVYLRSKDPRAVEWVQRSLTLLEALTKETQAEAGRLNAELARRKGQS
jgi:tetratricopeptide (TPR) repeat protein